MKMQTQEEIQAIEAPAIVADRQDFTSAMITVSGIIETKNDIPILNNVLIRGHGNHATLTASDMDLQITVNLDCAADSRFSATAPAKKLKELSQKAGKSDFVSMSHEMDCANTDFDFEGVNYTLNGIASNEFPEFPEFRQEAAQFSFKGDWFLDCLLSIYQAISTEETRYYLNGVFMEYDPKNCVMNFVATDGHRLYKRTVKAPIGADLMNNHNDSRSGVIIPRKAIITLLKLIKGKNTPETIAIKTTDARLDFSFDNVLISTKLVDGTFPDYTRVIPSGNSKVASFDAKQLIDAAVSTSLISDQKGRLIKLSLSQDQCDLSANNPNAGKAQTTIPCGYDGEQFEIGYNSKYLQELAKVACPKGGILTARFDNPGNPALFTSEIDGWIGVLMPMRI